MTNFHFSTATFSLLNIQWPINFRLSIFNFHHSNNNAQPRIFNSQLSLFTFLTAKDSYPNMSICFELSISNSKHPIFHFCFLTCHHPNSLVRDLPTCPSPILHTLLSTSTTSTWRTEPNIYLGVSLVRNSRETPNPTNINHTKFKQRESAKRESL